MFIVAFKIIQQIHFYHHIKHRNSTIIDIKYIIDRLKRDMSISIRIFIRQTR